jgi:predicted Zn-dependent protease
MDRVILTMLLRKLLALVIGLAFVMQPVAALAENRAAGHRLPLIRDAEIEGLLRLYTKPIFNAAGLDATAVKIYVIADPRINAFVAGGQRIFVHTGLLTRTKTPNQVIGVLAHEAGHITGGHLARLQNELKSASMQSIIGMLVGAAAMVGGAATGNSEAAKAGQGVVIGSQGMAQRNFLSYQRSMEASADQAALKFLDRSGQSAAGMLGLFQVLANESLAARQGADPYLQSHPMPLDRIRNLEITAKTSPHFRKTDSAALQLRHDLVKAKIIAFTESQQQVFTRYPKSNSTLPAIYAHAVSYMRRGDLKQMLPLTDKLISAIPQNPYFWELKAQGLLESGRTAQALENIQKARKLLPNNGLLQMMEAEILVAIGDTASADQALKVLQLARRTEAGTPNLYKTAATAYGLKGDIGRAELATAEYAFAAGDRSLALEKSKRATKILKKDTPEWVRAQDILNAASRKG